MHVLWKASQQGTHGTHHDTDDDTRSDHHYKLADA